MATEDQSAAALAGGAVSRRTPLSEKVLQEAMDAILAELQPFTSAHSPSFLSPSSSSSSSSSSPPLHSAVAGGNSSNNSKSSSSINHSSNSSSSGNRAEITAPAGGAAAAAAAATTTTGGEGGGGSEQKTGWYSYSLVKMVTGLALSSNHQDLAADFVR
jgi:hypothetical protein